MSNKLQVPTDHGFDVEAYFVSNQIHRFHICYIYDLLTVMFAWFNLKCRYISPQVIDTGKQLILESVQHTP